MSSTSGAERNNYWQRVRAHTSRRDLLILGAILILAAGLRFSRLDVQSIWFDEGWSIHLARLSPGEMFAQAAGAGHTHPPGYYLLLSAWERLAGHSIVAMRGLSALLGVLAVAAVYVLGRALYGRPSGALAALLMAVAPSQIVYAQEVRMYALLTLWAAVLPTLVYHLLCRRATWSRRHWVALVAAEIAAIYTHFFAVFTLAALAAWALARVIREAPGARRRLLISAALAQVAVAAAFLPWLEVTLRRVLTYETVGSSAPALGAFLAESWSFLLSGHMALWSGEPLYAGLAVACLGATLLLVAALFAWDRPRAGAHAFLLAQWLLPLAMTFLLMRARPGYHPRYIVHLFVPLAVLVAHGLAVVFRRGRPWRAVSGALAALWLGTAGVAGWAVLTETAYFRDDARATAAFVQEHLDADQLVLLGADDWALRYYLEGSDLDVRHISPAVLSADAATQIGALVRGYSQAALVEWVQGTTDPGGMLAYTLERYGLRLASTAMPAYGVEEYAAQAETPAIMTADPEVQIGPVRLLSASVETLCPTDDAMTVALTWRKEATDTQDYQLVLVLRDAEGRVMMQKNRSLYAADGRQIGAWAVGETVTTYHSFTFQPGLAPVAYELRVGLFSESEPEGEDVLDAAGAPAGKRLTVAEVQLAPPGGLVDRGAALEERGLVALPEGTEAAAGLELTAYGLPTAEVLAGERLAVLLYWRNAAGGALGDYWPEVRLVYDGVPIAAVEAAPVYGEYPTSWWLPGERILDWREIEVPDDAPGGVAELQVRVRGEQPVALAEIHIDAVERIWERPATAIETELPIGDFAALVGYDVADVAAPGEPLEVRLVWRAQARTDEDWRVFVHLLDADGRLIAGHDGDPAGDTRDTAAWVAGEYVVDVHSLLWEQSDYHGFAQIEVGFYDPLEGTRAVTPSGDSRLLLPSTIMVP